jgi:hypothetical protein
MVDEDMDSWRGRRMDELLRRGSLYEDDEGPEMATGREVRGEDILGRLDSGISSAALASREGRGGGGGEDGVGLVARLIVID